MNAAPETGRHPPLRDGVRDALRRGIFEGRFPPGMRLVERDLAEMFGVSRLPVREALRMLRQEGLVRERGRGMVVTVLATEDVQHLFDVRAVLEVLASRLATQRMNPENARLLTSVWQRAVDGLQQGQTAEVHTANAAFHDTIVELADNPFLTRSLEPLHAHLHWVFRQVDDADLGILVDEHERVLQAIVSGDDERAARASAKHVATNRGELIDRLDALGLLPE